ncbi:unnamed protein product [Chrysodeixis includens]|uniref:TOM1-like protein 2 n=1 Tax=Chrysodeixis includens TaxID=689277 RepID=A0A9P0FQ72_CHRIL|nr:unnamed protein product [Chrysodeixis includens]
MSFFGVGNPFSTPVGQKIEQATDGSLPSENWGLNMEICDIINSTPDGPKDAIKAIRKRLTQSAGKNYTIVMYTLTVLETCVKNCGKSFHVLVCSKEFISELVKLIGPKNDPPTVVQEKVLSLIQCWADAFQTTPDMQGVTQVYSELRLKGVEFPMTDLDAMAPIFTPQRSVPDGPEPIPESPQRQVIPQTSPSHSTMEQVPAAQQMPLTDSQNKKLRQDLTVVESNISVMNEMLNELTTQPHAAHHESDIKLLDVTLRSMQTRMVELISRVAGQSPLIVDLLYINDRLNNLLLRHSRFTSNRNAATSASPLSILGAAMGVPNAKPESPKPEDDALIDLRDDDVPDIAKLTVKDAQPDKTSQSSKDEFDMFAQSRNVTYESSKTGGSSYSDNMEAQSASSLVSAASQRATQGQPLAASEANLGTESVTSSDFDKFLAERAAAADTLPNANANANTNANTNLPTPRHRQINKDEQDSMFAL